MNIISRIFKLNCPNCGAVLNSAHDMNCPNCGRNVPNYIISEVFDRKCPVCKGNLNENTLRCPHCGTYVIKVYREQNHIRSQRHTVNRTYLTECPNCGAHTIKSGQPFCEYCGTQLVKYESVISTDGVSETFNELSDELIPVERLTTVPHGGLGIVRLIIGMVLLFLGTFETFFAQASESEFIATDAQIQVLLRFFPVFIGMMFFIPGIILILFAVKNVFKYQKCKKNKVIEGVVRGYDDALAEINGLHNKNVKIMVTEDGQKKIYNVFLRTPLRLYAINEKVHLSKYKNICIIH